MSYQFGLAKYRSEYSARSWVIGANGEPPDDWGDILYQYFRENYQGTQPPKYNKKGDEIFDSDNEPINEERDVYHVFFMRGDIREQSKLGSHRTELQDTYGFAIYVKSKDVSENFPHLHNILEEIKRIFIRQYPSHDMAGIHHFNNLTATGLQPPNSGANNTSAHWMIMGTLDLFYAMDNNYDATNAAGDDTQPWNSNRYHAGYNRRLGR